MTTLINQGLSLIAASINRAGSHGRDLIDILCNAKVTLPVCSLPLHALKAERILMNIGTQVDTVLKHDLKYTVFRKVCFLRVIFNVLAKPHIKASMDIRRNLL